MSLRFSKKRKLTTSGTVNMREMGRLLPETRLATIERADIVRLLNRSLEEPGEPAMRRAIPLAASCAVLTFERGSEESSSREDGGEEPEGG